MNNNNTQFTNEQYERVLTFMQTTNQQDYQKALETLKKFNFNIENAISFKLDDENLRNQEQYNMNVSHNQEMINRNNTNQEKVQRYINYLREKPRKSVFMNLIEFMKNFVIEVCIGIIQIICPNFILHKFYHSFFYNEYKPKIPFEFKDRNISYYLRHAYLSRKPIMFIIAAPKISHQCINKLFTNPKIVKKINESFIFCGTFSNDKQCNQIQGQKNPPNIIIFRINLYEKIQIIKRYTTQSQIQKIDVDQLNYTIRSHQQATRKDKTTYNNFQKYLRRQLNRPRYEQQQQQQMYEQKQLMVSSMIQKQNDDYKKIAQQSRIKEISMKQIKQKQEQQKRINQQLVQQRKIRKLSIPDEPIDGDIIRINFRCPNGSAISRNFANNEKLDLLYHWVETNQNIQFQDNSKRLFQLVYGFPPSSLTNKRDNQLKDVFESDQEKVIIKEL